jgi:hypothetical protein
MVGCSATRLSVRPTRAVSRTRASRWAVRRRWSGLLSSQAERSAIAASRLAGSEQPLRDSNRSTTSDGPQTTSPSGDSRLRSKIPPRAAAGPKVKSSPLKLPPR